MQSQVLLERAAVLLSKFQETGDPKFLKDIRNILEQQLPQAIDEDVNEEKLRTSITENAVWYALSRA